MAYSCASNLGGTVHAGARWGRAPPTPGEQASKEVSIASPGSSSTHTYEVKDHGTSYYLGGDLTRAKVVRRDQHLSGNDAACIYVDGKQTTFYDS